MKILLQENSSPNFASLDILSRPAWRIQLEPHEPSVLVIQQQSLEILKKVAKALKTIKIEEISPDAWSPQNTTHDIFQELKFHFDCCKNLLGLINRTCNGLNVATNSLPSLQPYGCIYRTSFEVLHYQRYENELLNFHLRGLVEKMETVPSNNLFALSKMELFHPIVGSFDEIFKDLYSSIKQMCSMKVVPTDNNLNINPSNPSNFSFYPTSYFSFEFAQSHLANWLTGLLRQLGDLYRQQPQLIPIKSKIS